MDYISYIYIYIYSKFNIIADIAFQNLKMRANRLQLFKIVGSKLSDLKISLKVCWKISWSSIKNIQLYKILQVNWLPDVQLRLYKHFRQSLKDHIAQSPQWLEHISVTATSGRREFDNNFDSWISQSLIFQIFNTYDVFICSGVYIPQFGLTYHRPCVVARVLDCWSWGWQFDVQNLRTWSTLGGEPKMFKLGQWRR